MKARPLTAPLAIFEDTPLTATEATDRLREAVTERRSVEPRPEARSRRHLAGDVTAHQVRLRVHDANSVTRRKDWNVELSGALETTDDGTALVGVIDVPDRRVLEGLMLLFRLVGAVFGLIALALAARGIVTDGELGLPPVLGLVVAAALTLGPSYVAREGERSAGEDAALLARSVHDILNAGRWRG